MLNGALDRVLRAFGNAMLMMALADDDYWYARTRLIDPEAARLLVGWTPEIEPGEAGSRAWDGDEAVLEAEWLLAAARADDVVSAA